MASPSARSCFIFTVIASSGPSPSPPVNPPSLLMPTACLSCCLDETLQQLSLHAPGRLHVIPSGRSLSATDNSADKTRSPQTHTKRGATHRFFAARRRPSASSSLKERRTKRSEVAMKCEHKQFANPRPSGVWQDTERRKSRIVTM